jgi:alpha-L-arabinofuranosidase
VSDLGPFTLLDATATCDADGRNVTVAVVNRDRERPHAATIDLGDAEAVAVDLAEVNGPSVETTNDFDGPERVRTIERSLPLRGKRLEHVFPAHSVSVLRLRLGG